MIIKILRWIFDKIKFVKNEWFQHGIYIYENNKTFEYFFIKIKKDNKKIYFDCFHLLTALITLIIFLILWKFDIQIVSKEFIIIYRNFIFYLFWFFIFYILFELIYGIYYNIKYNDNIIEKRVIKKIIKFLHFLIIINMLMYFLNIDFIELLQYNLLFIIDYINIILIYLHNKWLTWKIDNVRYPIHFVSYPWIIVLIMCILFYFNKKGGEKLTEINDSCFIEVEIEKII